MTSKNITTLSSNLLTQRDVLQGHAAGTNPIMYIFCHRQPANLNRCAYKTPSIAYFTSWQLVFSLTLDIL
jgi:hypothetical protein